MMECKCPELEEFEFLLNLDVEKLHDVSLIQATADDPNLIKVGFNIWISSPVSQKSYISEWLASLENAINEVKSELCPCFQSKMDTAKFVIVDNTDGNIPRPDALAWVTPGYNIITINFSLFSSLLESSSIYNQLKEAIYHELIHTFQYCPPCKDLAVIKFVDSQINTLYEEYRNFLKPIEKFTKDFSQTVLKALDNVVNPSFCELEFIDYVKSQGIIQFLDIRDFDYGGTNPAEFLASMSEQLCSPSLGVFNPRLAESFDRINDNCKDYVVNRFMDIKRAYLVQFNQKFNGLQTRVCDIWNKLYSSPDNCNEDFTNITYEISFYPTKTDKDGCTRQYLVQLAGKDAGCCQGESDNIVPMRLRIGYISRQNECDCDFLWSRLEHDADRLLDNCFSELKDGLSTRQYGGMDIINLIIDIENQVIDEINSKYAGKIKIIRDLSEKSNPCSK